MNRCPTTRPTGHPRPTGSGFLASLGAGERGR